MMEVSGLKELTEQEIESLSDWLSKQDVGKDPAYDIKMLKENAQAGEKNFVWTVETAIQKMVMVRKKKMPLLLQDSIPVICSLA